RRGGQGHGNPTFRRYHLDASQRERETMSDATTIEQAPTAASSFMNKVPQVTLAFWVIKIAATTLGETGGDALSMTLDLGYAVSTAVLFAFFAIAACAQISAQRFQPFLYWT